MKTLILTMIVAAAQAQEQPQPREQRQPQQAVQQTVAAAQREKLAAQNAEMAKKDVDVAGIHLQVAKLYVAGLYDLAGGASTWDREHGVALFNQAQNALTDAERQLGELQGLARNVSPKALEPLARARNTLAQVHGQLRSLSVPLRTGGGQDQAGQGILGQVYKSLDSALHDLESAAREMGVDPKLRTP